MITIQERNDDEQQKALKKEMENFYEQCKQLFVGISTESTTNEAGEAEPSKKDEGLPNSSFLFMPSTSPCQCDLDFEHSILMTCSKGLTNAFQSEAFENIIVVNSNSYAFERFLKDRRGFELPLLHQMLYLKMEEQPFFEGLYNQDFVYAKACNIFATRYPIDNNGEPEANKWPNRILGCFHYYRLEFMVLCYHVAKNLLQQDELLTRVLDGRIFEGGNTWEKNKWLAKLLYEGNVHEFDTSDSAENKLRICCADKATG